MHPTRKDGLPHQQLSKNAAYTPDVHLRPIALSPQQQLRRPECEVVAFN